MSGESPVQGLEDLTREELVERLQKAEKAKEILLKGRIEGESPRVFEPIEGIQHLTEIENPEFTGVPMRVEGVVSSTSLSYLVPREVEARWFNKDSGKIEEKSHVFNAYDPETIRFVGVKDKTKETMLSKIMETPRRSSPSFTETSRYTVYRLRLRPPVFRLFSRENKIIDEEDREYKHFDIFIVSTAKLNLAPSTRVVLEGKIQPEPKTQRATFVAVDIKFPESVGGYDRDAVLRLMARFEGMTVKQRVDWVLKNFEAYSHIVGRRTLAYAGFLTFFTPVWLDFDGDRQRGWGLMLIIGDTTTGKSELTYKMIRLLEAGVLITAETSSAVGLTAAAVKAEGGEWFTDFGFLVLCDRRLLAVDGYQKLSMRASSKLSEAERQGVVTKGTAAKGSAPARTRQIKISNAVDLETGRFGTKAMKEFFYPIQAVATVLDKTGIARLDIAVISDRRTVGAEEVNKLLGISYDEDLMIMAEVKKWAWGGQAEVEFTEDAVDRILNEATRLYNKFYCDSIPLVSIDFKHKLARLSIALARMTLSTTPDLKRVTVTREHVDEVVGFVEGEYTEAGLHSLAKSEVVEAPDEEDLTVLLQDLDVLGIDNKAAVSILRFIVVQGHVTKDMVKTKFNLSGNSQLRPLMAILQSQGYLKRGRGYYPTSKLNQMVRLIDNLGGYQS